MNVNYRQIIRSQSKNITNIKIKMVIFEQKILFKKYIPIWHWIRTKVIENRLIIDAIF